MTGKGNKMGPPIRIVTDTLRKETTGAGDVIDITADIQEIIKSAGFVEGTVTVFVVGSTAGITTVEFEPGLVQDLRHFWDRLIPEGPDYAHHATWGDRNGFSHLRAALQGPSLVIPFVNGSLVLGTWQQVVLAEFDERPRDRKVVLQILGA